ncbi:hypothetical protein DSBG_2105 [Desulfosporosinus sp. BG]|nr:hypothetical protein DSBG_2105 [Desulfosporosinus sp. BG]
MFQSLPISRSMMSVFYALHDVFLFCEIFKGYPDDDSSYTTEDCPKE